MQVIYLWIEHIFHIFNEIILQETFKEKILKRFTLAKQYIWQRFLFGINNFQKCPYGAINIINLPSNLEKKTTHRYSANSFKLHRLPTPRLGSVLGLVGCNGIGKSTALKVLANRLKPNLGCFKVCQVF